MSYPLLEHPLAVHRVLAETPTPEQSHELLDWFKSAQTRRIGILLEFLGIRSQGLGEDELIALVNERFDANVRTPEFSVPFKQVYPHLSVAGGNNLLLSEMGEAFCCDAGFLLASMLMHRNERMQWEVSPIRRPRYVYLRRPVMTGFSSGDELEPLWVMQNIGSRIINNTCRTPGSELSQGFRYWLDRA